MTDLEKLNLIKSWLKELHENRLSFESFAVLVEMIVDRAKLSQSDTDWAQRTAKKLGYFLGEPKKESTRSGGG